MTLEIRVRPEAEQDLTEAALWYEERSPGLGTQFLDEVRATCATISEMPKLYAVVHRETRRALMHRFPFGIYYQLDDAGIVVMAVMHGSRHPRNWKNRT